ncbi:MAG: hypothetical protein V9G14_00635 [Cypionkella sp.]
MAAKSTDNRPMIDRYRWWEFVLIYAGIFLFLFFMLAPFIEGFLVSLKPLSQLFSSPYRFWPENGSFDAYITMWTYGAALWALYLQLVPDLDRLDHDRFGCWLSRRPMPLRGFNIAGMALVLGGFLGGQHVFGRGAVDPAVPADAHAGAVEHLFRHGGAGGGLSDPLGDLVAAHLYDAHSGRVERGGLYGWRVAALHFSPGDPADCACRGSWLWRSPPLSGPMRSSSSSR